MGILFLVLKMIGFILLGLLAFLILLLLAVLFVPIRYRVVAQYEEKAIARITAGWFLHLIGVRLVISDQEKSCKLKLFGIPLIDFFLRARIEEKNEDQRVIRMNSLQNNRYIRINSLQNNQYIGINNR